jgi:hypothetical protein
VSLQRFLAPLQRNLRFWNIAPQLRGNESGGDGVVRENVEIPQFAQFQTEMDKDIALAIRYAVDNGAKVINGSFGKDYSPHKEWF